MPATPPPDVSVVICAYTQARWDDIVTAVRSLQAQRLPPREVILSIDHEPVLLERVRLAFPEVIAVPNRHRQGLSGARNSGLEVARSAVTAFLDDDARAEPDWIERLVRAYDDRAVAGVGGVIEPDWAGGRPRWFPPEFDWVVGCTYRGMPRERRAVRNLIGANMSFRRELFADVGGFVDCVGRVGTRPAGCEETEFCIRASRHRPGARIVLEPAARVRHRVPPERGRWGYFASRCWAEGWSKALVARRAGAHDALATERSYVAATLPRGVARGVGDALRRHDASGLTRAGAIIAGLGMTTAGFLAGMAISPRAPDATRRRWTGPTRDGSASRTRRRRAGPARASRGCRRTAPR